ncbi:serine/threonine-protein kinase OSR1-like [Oscarella lobularis]|uniref:serine/threonine-protein kinase OSR1-like n=1 Tax=Oscarella lobularis TaxID=121494 RepID=UPI00331345A5
MASSSQWPCSRSDYDLTEVIGFGATSVVQSAVCKPRKEKCAIKRIDLDKVGVSIEEISKEIQLMSQCRHENVASFYTAFLVNEELWIIMELMDGGSLLDIVKDIRDRVKAKGGCLEEGVIATTLEETLKGIDYLHRNHQIHRDIKAGNILMSKDGRVRVADFGVSSWFFEGGNARKRQRKTFVGTPCWMAPEVMDQEIGYDNKADIWSIGILTLELATGWAPYAKFPPMKALMLTLENDPPTLELCGDLFHDDYKKYSKSLRKFIEACLQKRPQDRPTATELLKHDFIKKKAKGKEFLMNRLFSRMSGTLRVQQKVKRVPGSSGKLHRTEDGGWEWSDDECGEEEEPKKSNSVRVVSKQQPIVLHVPDLKELSLDSKSAEETAELEELEEKKRKLQKQEEELSKQRVELQQERAALEEKEKALKDKDKGKEGSKQFALKIRNAEGKLKDIKFPFVYGKDTASGVAQELVAAGLIHKVNFESVRSAIEIAVGKASGRVTFELAGTSTGAPFDGKDEKNLVGYAQITIT